MRPSPQDNEVLVRIDQLKLITNLTLRNADSSAPRHDLRLAEYISLSSLRNRHAGSSNAKLCCSHVADIVEHIPLVLRY